MELRTNLGSLNITPHNQSVQSSPNKETAGGGGDRDVETGGGTNILRASDGEFVSKMHKVLR